MQNEAWIYFLSEETEYLSPRSFFFSTCQHTVWQTWISFWRDDDVTLLWQKICFILMLMMQFRKKHLNISCTKSQRRHELTTKPKLESLVFKHPPLFQRLYENIFVKYFYPFAHIPLQILPYLERTITFQNNFQPELGLLYHMYILHVKISALYFSQWQLQYCTMLSFDFCQKCVSTISVYFILDKISNNIEF